MPRFFLYFVGLQLKVAKVVGGAHRRGTSEPEESDLSGRAKTKNECHNKDLSKIPHGNL